MVGLEQRSNGRSEPSFTSLLFVCEQQRFWLGLQRYAHLMIQYVSRYKGHDTIRIAIHHKLFALLGNFVSGLQSVNHITETWVVSNTAWPKIFCHKHPY